MSRLYQRLNERKKSESKRHLTPLNDGIDFYSNDYLGLASDSVQTDLHCNPSVAERQALAFGSSGSRLISGNHPIIIQAENEIADFHGFEASVLFSCGYSANTGLLACLGERGDWILMDSLCHASLVDGARLSFAQRKRFEHNSLQSLEEQLQFAKARKVNHIFVVIESIYSMDGDSAPLPEIARLCAEYQAALIVDEAHSIGVVGRHGQGMVAEHGLQDKVLACMYAFGKALGSHGAVIASNSTLQQYLVNFCRPFIYTTAPSPRHVSDILRSHRLMQQADSQRIALESNIHRFRERLNATGALSSELLLNSLSAIQGLLVPGNQRCRQVAQHLQMQGFNIKAILSPTVAEGTERLRIVMHAHNSYEEIDQLVLALQEVEGKFSS